MYRVVSALQEIGAAAVILVPSALICNQIWLKSWKKTIYYLLFALYLVGVYDLTGLPDVLYHPWDPVVDLIPLLGMAEDAANSALNVLLFVPLGAALPVLSGGFRRGKDVLLFGLGMSALIEVMQLFTFRATDINDLLTNTAGAGLGWLLGRAVLKRAPTLAMDASRRELYALCGAAFLTMFFLQPPISGLLWTRILGG